MTKKLQSGGRPLRIAYGRIFHEGNSYSPLQTEADQFQDFHFFEGAALQELIEGPRHELVDVLKKAELTGFLDTARQAGAVECIPLLSALAVPSGPISTACFAWIRERLRASLERVGKVDAVYLALHGSMRVADLEDAPEGILINDARSIVGRDAKIAVSYDLHANLSPAIVDSTDILEGFRTNPHRDLYKTGVRAATQLIQTLRGDIRPVRAWRKLPVIVGGGMTIDFLNPMRPIFRHMKKICTRPDVVSAHVFMVHPFTDAKDLGWAVHVATDNDQALADRLADEMAELVWKAREVPIPSFESPSQMIGKIRKARLARSLGHVSVVDTSDVVGAGSTGGNTHILDALVKEGSDLRVLLPLHDPRAVAALWDHATGTKVEACLRGTQGLDEQPIVTISVRIDKRITTEFGRTMLLRYDELCIAVTEKPPGAVHPKFWRALGLSPWKADAIIQKFFFHYRIFFVASARKNLAVATEGPSSLERVQKRQFDLPMSPRDAVDGWRSFDQIRRAEVIATDVA